MGNNWGTVIDGILSRRAKRKKRQLEARFKNTCPHATVERHGEEFMLRSLFVSPSGTLDWICQQCNLVTHDVSIYHDGFSNAGPDDYMRVMKKQEAFRKLARKHGYV